MSCERNYVYKQIDRSEVFENKKTLIYHKSAQRIYRVCKDFGPPQNDLCFLVIESGKKYFKINPKYRYAIINDSIFLYQTISFNYSVNGNWIFIEKKFTGGQKFIHFNYDTVPPMTIHPKANGVFYLKNNNFRKIGNLTSYQSIHDLPYDGFYYLSSPGLFYERAIAFEDIK